MARDVDLMGVGFPAEQAVQVGISQVDVTAAGTLQTDGTQLTYKQTGVRLTTAGGADSVVLPADMPRWQPLYIWNQSATTANVYPSSGMSINAAGANNAVTVAQNLARVFYRVGATQWFSFLAA